MKTRIPVVLALAAALALAACAPAQTADAPQNVQTAETAPAQETAPEPQTAGPAGAFFTVEAWNATEPVFNAGDAYYMLDPTYHLGYCLLTEIDYATAEQRVVCRVPGCGHDTDACPAYFPGKGRELCVFTVGETLYVYRPVVTMHYEGSWDDYYAEVVAPKLQERPQGWETLTDEELLAYCRGRYAEQSAPAGLYVIEGDGTSRRELTCTQDLANTTMRWCDGAALYGYAYDALPTGNSAGYRIALADGSVTTFPLMQYEKIVGAQGGRLLTSRPVADAPLPDPGQNWEAYDAAMQNAVVEYDWLDPATGARSKVLERPRDASLYEDNGFCGLLNGELIFEEQELQDDGTALGRSFCAYDPAAGTWRDLLRPLPDASMTLQHPDAACPASSAACTAPYLWFTGSSGWTEDLTWVLDIRTGTLTAVQQKLADAPYGPQAVYPLAQTDDGRFLVRTAYRGEGEPYDCGLIAIDAFLQGSTDYTPVQMLA